MSAVNAHRPLILLVLLFFSRHTVGIGSERLPIPRVDESDVGGALVATRLTSRGRSVVHGSIQLHAQTGSARHTNLK
jgi:hypothetical protein